MRAWEWGPPPGLCGGSARQGSRLGLHQRQQDFLRVAPSAKCETLASLPLTWPRFSDQRKGDGPQAQAAPGSAGTFAFSPRAPAGSGLLRPHLAGLWGASTSTFRCPCPSLARFFERMGPRRQGRLETRHSSPPGLGLRHLALKLRARSPGRPGHAPWTLAGAAPLPLSFAFDSVHAGFRCSRIATLPPTSAGSALRAEVPAEAAGAHRGPVLVCGIRRSGYLFYPHGRNHTPQNCQLCPSRVVFEFSQRTGVGSWDGTSKTWGTEMLAEQSARWRGGVVPGALAPGSCDIADASSILEECERRKMLLIFLLL